MDINQVITKEDFDMIKKLTYDQVCEYIMRIVKLSVEESLRVLPSVANHVVNQASYLSMISDKFYDEHPNLARNKAMVVQMLEEAESENPGQAYGKLLENIVPKAEMKLKELSNINVIEGSKDLDDLDDSLGKL